MSEPAAPLSPLGATANLVVEFTPAEDAPGRTSTRRCGAGSSEWRPISKDQLAVAGRSAIAGA